MQEARDAERPWRRRRRGAAQPQNGAESQGLSRCPLRLSLLCSQKFFKPATLNQATKPVAVSEQSQNPICCQLDERRFSNLVDPMYGRIDSPKGKVQSVRSDEGRKGFAVARNSERILCSESQQTLFG